MSDRHARRGRPGPSAGFTLVEVMIAIVLTGILAGVLFQLIQGQSRFTETQTARQSVQGNVRASMELIASELRAVPAAGVVTSGANTLRVRVPRVYGMLCNNFNGTGTAWVAVPRSTRPADLPAVGNWTGVQHWGLAFANAAAPGSVVVGQINGRQPDADGAAPCAATLQVNAAAVDYVGVNVTALAASIPPAVLPIPAGTQVFVFQEVEYSTDEVTQTGMSGRWLTRANGVVGSLTAVTSAGRQPLAGPLLDTLGVQGLALRYRCGGAEVAPGAVRFNNADQIRVVLAMRSRTGSSSDIQTLVDSTTIHLRNTEIVTC